MRIGILGTGNVGGNLGRRWSSVGHDVIFGSRDPESDRIRRLVASTGGTARASTIGDACSNSEVVVIAVPSSAVTDVMKQCGDLAGKVVVNATNSVDWTNRARGTAATSIAEEIASIAPVARMVKAFNAIGADHYLDPIFEDTAADIFICGDDGPAKASVAALASDIGFEVVDAGPLSNARLLEDLAILWIYLAYRGGLGRNIAFKLLRK